ncbi:MAG: heme exporter protein CcmB, partial [Deltaproteobacteria bacterium]|nr:heme exporter protein CcmB [Deltaproteobacteria bacterium]
MSFLSTAILILKKDLMMEFKSRELILSTGMFSLLIVVLSAFSFDVNKIEPSLAASGAIWIAIALGGILATERLFNKEKEMNTWLAIVLSPSSRNGIFAGKFLSLSIFLIIIMIFLLPIIKLFFGVEVNAPFYYLPLIMVLGITGFSSIGALFGALIVKTSRREMVLGIVMLPLCAPVLILSSKATLALLETGTNLELNGYIKILGVLNIIYLSIALWLFEYL